MRKLLDKLRTAYSKAPASVRGKLAPFLVLAPIASLYGSTYTEYRDNIDRSAHDEGFVREWRRKRLCEILGCAIDKSPYYQRIAQEHGITYDALARLGEAALAQFPILTKEMIREHRMQMLTCSKDALSEISTGGSSGTPLSFYLDKDRSVKEWAFLQDYWSKIGFTPKCVRAVFRGVLIDNVDTKPWEYDAALRELRLSPFHLTDEFEAKYCQLIQQKGIAYLHGYPSAISIFAGYVQRTNHAIRRQIKGVICASEQLHAYQREAIEHAFPNAQVTSFYGLSEKVLIGNEVRQRPGVYDLQPLYGYAELVDEAGEAILEPGRRGRLLGTSLLFQGMPLIRYDTGDTAELVALPTEKNLHRMRICAIEPRRGTEFVVGAQGQLISMTAINIHSSAYSKILAFQFRQRKPGEVRLCVSLAPGATPADLEPFVREISTKIGQSVQFEVELKADMQRTARGKAKFIEQELDISQYL